MSAPYVVIEVPLNDPRTPVRAYIMKRGENKTAQDDGIFPCMGCPIPFRMAPPSGPSDPVTYVVGEAPGSEEDTARVPFIGPAGKLIKQALAQAGYDLETTRFFNATACAPRDDINLIRTPTPDEALNCSKFVRADVQDCQPQRLILLGKVALRVFTTQAPEFAKLTMRDAIRTCREAGYWKWHDIRTMVAYHPSYILRRGGATSGEYAAWVKSLENFAEVTETLSVTR